MHSINRFMTVLFTSAAVMVMPALAFAETPPSAESDGPLQLNDPDIVQKAKDQLGLGFPTNYQDEECVPVGKSDPCLPTGFVQAIERGEPYITLWKAELLVEQGKALGADKLLLEIEKKHPNNAKALWLIAKNAYFRAEKMPEEATEERLRFLSGVSALRSDVWKLLRRTSIAYFTLVHFWVGYRRIVGLFPRPQMETMLRTTGCVHLKPRNITAFHLPTHPLVR